MPADLFAIRFRRFSNNDSEFAVVRAFNRMEALQNFMKLYQAAKECFYVEAFYAGGEVLEEGTEEEKLHR